MYTRWESYAASSGFGFWAKTLRGHAVYLIFLFFRRGGEGGSLAAVETAGVQVTKVKLYSTNSIFPFNSKHSKDRFMLLIFLTDISKLS